MSTMGHDNQTPERVDVRGVEVLRTGKFKGREFTDEYLRKIVESYDPNVLEAQLLFDHVDSGPAGKGRLVSMSWQPGRVLADFTDVPKNVADEMLPGGSWSRRSAEVYNDLEGRGPYMRNIALLGAATPAVKGLSPVDKTNIVPLGAPTITLSEDGEDGTVFTFAFDSTEPMERLRESTSPKGDKPMTKEVEAVEPNETVKLAEPTVEAEPNEEVVALSEKVARLEEQNQKLIKMQLATDQERRIERAEKYVAEFLQEKGEAYTAFAESGMAKVIALSEDHSGVIKLGEDEVGLADALRKMFDALPSRLELGEEVAKHSVNADGTINLSESEKAMADNLGVSYEAFAETLKGGN